MSTQSKKRRVIAYQSKYGSDIVNIYKCGDCQCFFPSLRTIHAHFVSSSRNLNPPACQNKFPLEESRPQNVKASNRNITKSIDSNRTKHHLSTSSKMIDKPVDSSNTDHSQFATSVDSSQESIIESGVTSEKTESFDLIFVKDNELASEPVNNSNRNGQDPDTPGKTKTFDHLKEFCCPIEVASSKSVHVPSMILNVSQFLVGETTTNISIQSKKNVSGEIKVESVKDIDQPSDEIMFRVLNTSSRNKNDREETSVSVDSNVKRYSDTYTSINVSECKSIGNDTIVVTSINRGLTCGIQSHENDKDIAENPVSSDVINAINDANCTLTSKNAHTRLSCSKSIDTSVGLSASFRQNQTDEVGCLDEIDNKLDDIDIEPPKPSAEIVSKNTCVSDRITIPQLKDNKNNSEYNENDSRINDAVIEYKDIAVLNPSDSIKCEETGNGVVSVDISSISTPNSELSFDKRKEDLASDPCIGKFSKKVGQDVSLKIEQQLMRHQTKKCMNESKLANDKIRPNQTRVLITYNEKENTDLKLECEDDHRRKCCGVETHRVSLNEEGPGKFTRGNTCHEDNKSDGHLDNTIDNKVDITPVSCIEGSRNDKQEPHKGFIVQDLSDGNTTDDYSVDGSSTDKNSVMNINNNYCIKCNTHFAELNCFINHLILFHHPAYTRKDLTWCPSCSNKKLYCSYFNSHLKRHLKFVHDFDEMKCLRCDLKFDTCYKLKKHVKVCREGFLNPIRHQIQCRKCKTFHVYKPAKDSRTVLEDIVRTLPDDKEVNDLKVKDEKLQGSTAKQGPGEKLQCELCGLVFKHISCALNHAMVVHMKDTYKKKCSLFRRITANYVCDLCNKSHKIAFHSSKRMRTRLFKKTEQLNLTDTRALSVIRDGLAKYYGYKTPKTFLYIKKTRHFCKECNKHFGSWSCGLNHMIIAHFSRANINMAIKSSFLNKKKLIKKCKIFCKDIHYFVVSDINRLARCLAYKSEDSANYSDKSLKEDQLSPTCTGSSIIKRLQTIVKFDETFRRTRKKLDYMNHTSKILVNVVAAKTKEAISKDMEYRVAYVNGNFLCRLCHSKYNRYSCCKSHVLTEHSPFFNYREGSEVYTCPECMKHFHSLHQLDIHLERVHFIYRFTCIKCDERFNTYREYFSHVKHGKKYIQTHFNEKLSCQECRLLHNCAVQTGEEELIVSLPSEDEMIFKKIQTNRTMSMDDGRSTSEIANNSEQNKDCYSDVAFDGKQFVCLVCLKQFEELACCFTHVIMQHYQMAELICKICQETSRRKTKHLSHLRTHHGLEQHYCCHCYTGFEDMDLRDNHSEHCKIQTKNVPDHVDEHLCRKCYAVHLHFEEGNIDSTCGVCELGFSSVGCAKNHFFQKHFPTWVILASTENIFICPCGKEVLKKSELTLHLQNDHSCSKQAKIDHVKSDQSQNHEKSANKDYDTDSWFKTKKELHDKDHVQTDPSESYEKSGNKDYGSHFKTKEELHNKCVECDNIHIIASNTARVSKRKATSSCTVCQKIFSSHSCLQNHVLAAHSSKFQPRQCVGCGLHFAGSNSLKRHQNEYHTLNEGHKNDIVTDKTCRKNVSIVQCDDCKKVHQHQFSMEEKQLKKAISPKAIKDERQRNVDKYKHVLKCRFCSLGFTKLKDLIAHGRSVHEKIKDEKGVICEVCNKEIDKSMFYSDHLKQVHCNFTLVEGELLENFERNFSCVYCAKNFSFLMDVQMHLRSKHFEKPLSVRKHYKTELEGILVNGIGILHCPLCFEFMKHNARGHIDLHFNNISEKGKTNICDICGKSVNNLIMADHKASHSGIRKYKCTICAKSFVYYSNLQTHLLVHKDKKETCSTCGMKFTLPHQLRAHFKRKHPESL